MRQIYTAAGLRDTDLAALYAYPPGPWLRANMVSSADGAAHLNGMTRGLSSEADRHLFALLRTLADVIVVGAATVRAERYAPVRQHELWPDLRPGRTPTPPIAVVTARLDLDPSSRLIAAAPPSARTIIITTAQAPADRRAALDGPAEVIVAGQERVDLKAAIAALAERGHRRMLAEGGPHLLAHIAAADLLDELCLTIGPVLAGPGADRILAGSTSIMPPQMLALAHVLEDDGFLFCRYTRKNPLFRTDRGACPRRTPRRSMVDTQGGAWVTEAAMMLRPRRRNLVVWGQSVGPTDRNGGPRAGRTRLIRRRIRIGVLLTIVTLIPLVRAVRARWRMLLPGAVLTVAGVMLRGSPAGVVLLPGLLLVMSAPLIPATPKAERLRRSELERELAAYATPTQRRDLEATLDRYPDGITRELRDILARQATAAAKPRIPGCGRV